MRVFGCLLLVLLAALVFAEEERISALPTVTTAPQTNPARASAISSNEKHIVAIDVGHTRVSPGAISATGIPEYKFNLRIAERVRAALATSKNIEPFVISSEKAMSLTERTRLAAAHNAELFVSIHHDSAQDKYLKDWEVDGKEEKYADQFSGYSVFVSRKNPRYEESFEVARGIGREMAAKGFKFATHHHEAIRGENRPIIDDEAGIYAFDDLVVLKSAAMPAVLVECGVILNRDEEQSLLTPERQAGITAAIVRGVTDYFARARETLPRAVVSKTTIEKAEPASEKSSQPGAIVEARPNARVKPKKYPIPGMPPKPEPVRSTDDRP